MVKRSVRLLLGFSLSLIIPKIKEKQRVLNYFEIFVKTNLHLLLSLTVFILSSLYPKCLTEVWHCIKIKMYVCIFVL